MSSPDRVSVDDNDVLSWLLDALLPDRGYMTIQVEAYFDESGTHDGSPVLCVAGYCLEKKQAKELSREWSAVLKARKLPHFHMTDCALGFGAFKGWTKDDRILVATRMIELIKKRIVHGIGVTVNEKEYDNIVPKDRRLGDAYAFCTHLAATSLRAWIQQQPTIDKVSFFFEAGHKSQTKANTIFNELFSDPEARKAYRYVSHTFVEKTSVPIIQAADLLAWHCFTDRKHIIGGRPRRKDFVSLLKAHHVIQHVDEQKLKEVAGEFARIVGGKFEQ